MNECSSHLYLNNDPVRDALVLNDLKGTTSGTQQRACPSAQNTWAHIIINTRELS